MKSAHTYYQAFESKIHSKLNKCSCPMKRLSNGKIVRHHTCGKGFWDKINNTSFNQIGPVWGHGITHGTGIWDSAFNAFFDGMTRN